MKVPVIAMLMVTVFTCLSAQEVKDTQKSSVLIAMEETAFKKALVKKMQTLLEQKQTEITIVKDSKKDIQQYKASDYDLVFITNSGVWSKVRPWITEWIDNNKADSSKILLHTTKKLKWEENVYVDAVSSASEKKEVDKLAEEYVNKLLSKR